MRWWIVSCLLGVVLVPASQAQETGEFGRINDIVASGTLYHVFARPGDATVQIMVIGAEEGSGIYEVTEGTDLTRLLVLASGLSLQPQDQRTRREVTIRLYREQGGRRAIIYEAPLVDMLGEPAQTPVLQDGDILQVEIIERRRFGWRDGLTVITAVATVTLAIDRVIRTLN